VAELVLEPTDEPRVVRFLALTDLVHESMRHGLDADARGGGPALDQLVGAAGVDGVAEDEYALGLLQQGRGRTDLVELPSDVEGALVLERPVTVGRPDSIVDRSGHRRSLGVAAAPSAPFERTAAG
jgi:hypothetical protein